MACIFHYNEPQSNEHWKRKDFEYEICENEFSHMYVYEEDKKILGIIGYYILFDDAQVTTIAVLKEARGKSIATKMMNAMIDDCNSKMCSQLSLEVRQSNQKAINLYKKFDFIRWRL